MLVQKNGTEIYIAPVVFGAVPCELQGVGGKPFEGVLSKVEQYVMAYRVDWDGLKHILPEGYASLRPVLRINVELLKDVAWLAGRSYHRVELNTPVEYKGKKGWFNLVTWEDDCDSILYGRDVHGIPKRHAVIHVEKKGQTTRVMAQEGDFTFLDIAFAKVGKAGGCPKEADNEGTFHFRYLPKIGEGFSEAKVSETGFMPVERIDESKEYCDCTFAWHEPAFRDAPMGYRLLSEICKIKMQVILGAYVVYFDRTQNYGEQVVL